MAPTLDFDGDEEWRRVLHVKPVRPESDAASAQPELVKDVFATQDASAAALGATIIPEAGFVVKTMVSSIDESKGGLWPGVKVLINVVFHDEMERPVPHEGRLPVVVSQARVDHDNSGKECVVFDCCVHTELYNAAVNAGDSTDAAEAAEMRSALVEACLECIEKVNRQSHVRLSRAFSLPRLRHKGIIAPVVLRQGRAVPSSTLQIEEVENGHASVALVPLEALQVPGELVLVSRDALLNRELARCMVRVQPSARRIEFRRGDDVVYEAPLPLDTALKLQGAPRVYLDARDILLIALPLEQHTYTA